MLDDIEAGRDPQQRLCYERNGEKMTKAFVFGEGTMGQASPKVGTRTDIGFFVRSAWEANMVRFYRKTGTCFIYEPCEFEFVGLKRGNRFYKPDFYLPKEIGVRRTEGIP